MAPDQVGHREPVAQPIGATIAVVDETVQELEAGNRVPVGIVGMHPDLEVGEGEVRRISLCSHIEDLAVVGLAHIAEQVHDPEDRSRRGRHLLDQTEPQVAYTDQPVT